MYTDALAMQILSIDRDLWQYFDLYTGGLILDPVSIYDNMSYRNIFVVSKPQWFRSSHRFENWQTLGQLCCWYACRTVERSHNFKCRSRGFSSIRDLKIRHLIGYWKEALVIRLTSFTARREMHEYWIDWSMILDTYRNGRQLPYM